MGSGNRINLLITGVGGGGHGEQVLKALKMAKTPYTIIGTDMSPISMGLYEVDKAYIVPRADDSAYISTMLGICKKGECSSIDYRLRTGTLKDIRK